jgi:hypothetical protein
MEEIKGEEKKKTGSRLWIYPLLFLITFCCHHHRGSGMDVWKIIIIYRTRLHIYSARI